MALTGGISFFKDSKTYFKNGTVATATTNDVITKNILANNTSIGWYSDGSNDTITEVITITLPSAVAIDRIFMLGHNWKEFEVKYWNGASFVSFANVVGINGSVAGGILETIFEKDASYYQFDSVSTDIIQVSVTKTQIINEEKFLDRFFATEELGTFEGYPLAVPKYSQNEVVQKVLSSKFSIQKANETEELNISFKAYPYKTDFDLLNSLYESNTPFFVWLCGGRFESKFFRIPIKGFDLKDLFLLQTRGKFNPKYFKNVYINGWDAKVKMVSSI